jgi:hypothetical protein
MVQRNTKNENEKKNRSMKFKTMDATKMDFEDG